MPKYTLEIGGKTYDIESDRPLSDSDLATYAQKIVAPRQTQPSAPPGQIPGAGPYQAPPERLPNPRSRPMVDIPAGLVRGAGSIGSVLVEAGRTAMPESMGGAPAATFLPRVAQRGQDISAGLQSLVGADPESLAFSGGKLAGEVAGTMGVGPAMAGAARGVGAAAPVVEALKFGGMAPTTASTAARGAATRLGAGATVGGASGALISPEDVGTSAVLGAALPAVAGPIKAGAGAVNRAVIQPLLDPASTARNAMLGALGGDAQQAINALRATQGDRKSVV